MPDLLDEPSSVYAHYVTKVDGRGRRTKAELHQVIEWLTGFDEAALEHARK